MKVEGKEQEQGQFGNEGLSWNKSKVKDPNSQNNPFWNIYPT